MCLSNSKLDYVVLAPFIDLFGPFFMLKCLISTTQSRTFLPDTCAFLVAFGIPSGWLKAGLSEGLVHNELYTLRSLSCWFITTFGHR